MRDFDIRTQEMRKCATKNTLIFFVATSNEDSCETWKHRENVYIEEKYEYYSIEGAKRVSMLGSYEKP